MPSCCQFHAKGRNHICISYSGPNGTEYAQNACWARATQICFQMVFNFCFLLSSTVSAFTTRRVGIAGIIIEKKKTVKQSHFPDDNQKLLQLVKKFSIGYKINIQKSFAFLYSNNKQRENRNRIISLTTAPKLIKQFVLVLKNSKHL